MEFGRSHLYSRWYSHLLAVRICCLHLLIVRTCSMSKNRSREKLSHYDSKGRARMVDVSAKLKTAREAEASAFVRMKPAVLRALPSNPKGDPLEVARMAGIMGAKRTSDL